MEMGDEDSVYLAEMNPALAQLQLGSFATVYHKQLVMHLNDL